MKARDGPSSTQSPTKMVSFQRGNSRVIPLPSPRSNFSRLRPGFPGQKYLAAQQQARKPSNPIKKGTADDDEWQDVDENTNLKNSAGSMLHWPDLKPPPQETLSDDTPTPTSSKNQTVSLENGDDNLSQDMPSSKLTSKNRTHERNESPASSNRRTEISDATDSTSNSFLNFSPTNAGASFIRRLGKQGHKLRSRAWRWNDDSMNDDMSNTDMYGRSFNIVDHQANSRSYNYPSSGLGSSGASSQQSVPPQSTPPSRPFWMDPALPGLIALYLQVSFNMIMVFSLLYAIGIFYATIRNDVNLKVEEYSVDIVDQISKCSFEYIRNGCEPDKRVPAIEAACQQWERCMQRDPKEVGRAKVSAETFGTIIEAFIHPIGFKSMMFLFMMFAGSFLLVNGVFSSKIGPRYNASSQQHFQQHYAYTPPPHQQHQPEHPQHQTIPQQPTPASTYQSHYIQQQPSIVYTPAHVSSPRYRNLPLQSSPVRQSPYRF